VNSAFSVQWGEKGGHGFSRIGTDRGVLMKTPQGVSRAGVRAVGKARLRAGGDEGSGLCTEGAQEMQKGRGRWAVLRDQF
jgi:hypothetical protein